ncbi:SDR family NAD(P)-dependent oxidoreductase [Novosphingobium colocasiae]
MIRASAPHFRSNGFGAVVNVSSLGGLIGIGTSMAYACSKGALNTMTLFFCPVARSRDSRQRGLPWLHGDAVVQRPAR